VDEHTAVHMPLEPTAARLRGLSRVGALGLAMLTVVALLALLPGLLAPYNPAVTVGKPLDGPSLQHWLGTNDVGHDLLSELIWGTRVSLTIGVSAAVLAVLAGLAVGIGAAYFGGLTDAALMRLVDLMLVIPVFPLLLLVAIYVGPGVFKMTALIAALAWADPARLLRSQALAVTASEYVAAAQALGATDLRVIVKHVLPAVLPLAVGQFAPMVGRAILVEAGLSFLGLGDPTQKSWGSMLYFARSGGAYLTRAWLWWVVPPGLMISLTILGFAFLGIALEERLNPILKA